MLSIQDLIPPDYMISIFKKLPRATKTVTLGCVLLSECGVSFDNPYKKSKILFPSSVFYKNMVYTALDKAAKAACEMFAWVKGKTKDKEVLLDLAIICDNASLIVTPSL